jgi:3-phenylpropionate/cinnamic acid dioxygenase small subunit
MTDQEQLQLTLRVQMLNARYASSIDNDRLEEWPGYFTERCLYKITSQDNVARGLPLGMVYCDTRGMLEDRVMSLREANIYEPHRYRHLLGMPLVNGRDADGAVAAETGFIVARVMRNGQTSVFASGRYLDKVEEVDARLLLRERIVVCDSSHVHTLLAMPL